MRLRKHKRSNRHRANAADRDVQTPTMAVRPQPWQDPTQTLVFPAIKATDLPPTQVLPRVPAELAREVTQFDTEVLPALRGVKPTPSQVWTAVHDAKSDRNWPDEDHDPRTPEQINAHANAMAATNDNRMAALEAQSHRRDTAIAKFAQRWQHDDAHWVRVAETLKAKRDASDAGRISAAYAEDGTSAALYMVDELAHEITRRALAGSAVSR